MKRVCLVMLVMALFIGALLNCPLAFADSRALPAGTPLQVRVIENLSSAAAKVGDTFHGTLAQAVVVQGRTVFPKGADVLGEVISVERSGRLSSPGELHLIIKSISPPRSRPYSVSVEPLLLKGASHTKSNVTKIGGGTAAGAVLGGMAGGGKGAAIGAGIGAGAGTGVAALTGKQEAVVRSEDILTWTAAATPAATLGGINPRVRGGRSYSSDPQQRSVSTYNQNDSYEAQAQARQNRRRDQDDDDDYYRRRSVSDVFSARDRDLIRSCLVGGRSGLPPGLAKRDRLPPGLERQVQRNGTLPPGLQKRVQPLPRNCELRLPRLPVDWSRVLLGGRVLLLDPARRVMDLFFLQPED